MVSRCSSSSYICVYCDRDVSRSFFVHCAECSPSSSVFLCGDCFLSGVDVPEAHHRSDHKYIVATCLEIPLFSKDWTVSEELALLDGIERCGIGNWKVISDDFIPSKTAKQLEDHYWELYLGLHGYCLPQQYLDVNGDLQQCVAPALQEEEEEEGPNRIPVRPGYSLGESVVRDAGRDHHCRTGGGLGAKDKQELKEKQAKLPGHELAGFIPLRGDFDNEFDNDAERMLSDMEFGLDEHPSERELKLQVIRIYNRRLEERRERKDFAIERGLVDCKQQQLQDRKRSREERELVGKLRVFARFHSKDEHDALVEGLLRARKLRAQVELYCAYRSAGIRTLEEARDYEALKRSREKDLKAKRHRESAPYLFGADEFSEGLGLGLDTANPQANPQLPSSEVGSSSSSLSTARLSSSSRRRRSGGDNSESDTAAISHPIPFSNHSVLPAGRGRKVVAVGAAAVQNPTSSLTATSYPSGRQQRMLTPAEVKSSSSRDDDADGDQDILLADLSKAPGGDLLSDMELSLCSSVPIMPLHYLAAKDAITREAYRNGSLTANGVRRTLKVDATRADKVFDFFVKELLING